ncbi:MAG: putative selenium-dependent hydroxylase accessory protein YqeC [Chloroflexi bacterium]|nr:putative selenium-dependent hydroxylase accessory protein YqeC [Chloroflexota bacterium]
MNFSRSLRLDKSSRAVVVFAGAGGKTSALFRLARELAAHGEVVATASSHLGVWQIPLADRRVVAEAAKEVELAGKGVTLVTGAVEGDKIKPIDKISLNLLREKRKTQPFPLLIEADGSRQKPLKAPAAHEPPIPEFADLVIYVAGMTALGKPLTDEYVHRAEIFSRLGGLPLGRPVTPQALVRVLAHPQGGLKNIPPGARRVAFLNQADSPPLQSIGGDMARELLGCFDAVLVGSLQNSTLHTFERTAGVILAAGESSRFGAPKQLLEWKGKPFVRQVAETALKSGLEPVTVVTGFHAAEVESALSGLPALVVHNPDYRQGQGTSIRAGLASLSDKVGAAIFLLADQPQIPVEVVRALVESHGREMQTILAPLALEERRANPVLFDRDTFPYLMELKGDVGGRAIFDKFRVDYLPWYDDILLLDVDKPQDYKKLKELE